MDAETIAALERAVRHCDEIAQKYERWISFDSPPPTWIDAYKAAMKEVETDAAAIRALIERERNGGERAQIVAWLRDEAGKISDIDRHVDYHLLADAIAAGAHKEQTDAG